MKEINRPQDNSTPRHSDAWVGHTLRTAANIAMLTLILTACSSQHPEKGSDTEQHTSDCPPAYKAALDKLVYGLKNAKREVSWDFAATGEHGPAKNLGVISEDSLDKWQIVIEESRGGILKNVMMANKGVDRKSVDSLTKELNFYTDSTKGTIHIVYEYAQYTDNTSESLGEVVFIPNKK